MYNTRQLTVFQNSSSLISKEVINFVTFNPSTYSNFGKNTCISQLVNLPISLTKSVQDAGRHLINGAWFIEKIMRKIFLETRNISCTSFIKDRSVLTDHARKNNYRQNNFHRFDWKIVNATLQIISCSVFLIRPKSVFYKSKAT